MNPFDYAFGLVSIVIGLAIGDMAISLHKLLRHRRTVRWDARVVLSAAYVFLVVTGMWFQFWFVRERADVLEYWMFLTFVVELLIVFLMAAAVLPDEPTAEQDLAQFYTASARSVWTLVALFQTSFTAHWIYFAVTGQHTRSVADFVTETAITLLPVLLAAVLAIWPGRRRLHLVVITTLIAVQLLDLTGASLS